MKTWIKVRQFTTACKIIREGEGAAIISAFDAEQYRDDGIIIRAFAPQISHHVSLILPKPGSASKLAQDFLDHFKESLLPFIAE